jgi:transcriptional regulator with XRE-family HTH domain
MSTEIFNTLRNLFNIEYIKLNLMTEPLREDFADLVRRLRTEQDLSLKDVENNSGGKIDSSYVSQIENRGVLPENLTIKKIKALAKGLKTSEDLLVDVARGKAPSGEVTQEVERDLKLLKWMFLDVPRECQLDVLASLTGIHGRRSLSHKIADRHEARAGARAEIDLKVSAMEYQNQDQQSPVTKAAVKRVRGKGRNSHTAKATFEGVEKPRTKAVSHEKKRQANNK